MPTIKLTKSAVEKLPSPKKGQQIYRDSILRGFAVRVGSNSKVYIVEGQVNNRTVRCTIGRTDVYSTEMAKKKAIDLLCQMSDGINPNQAKREELKHNITLQEAFRIYMETKSLSEGTLDHYTRTVNLYLKDWAKKPMREISKQMVLKRHQKLTKGRGAYTANSVMRHLRSVYNFTTATAENFPPNPVSILTLARSWNREQRRQTVIPSHKLGVWYEAVLQLEEYARDFLLICLFTGMRRKEVASLQWENIDLEGKLLHIPRTKNGDPLDLPLSDFLTDLLRNRRRMTNSEWVFPGAGKTGHLVEHKKFLRRVEDLCDVKFTFHDLRRTFITIAESIDTPSYALKRLLNHRTDNDVTGGYIVINAERLRDPVERIANRIMELVEDTPA